MSTVQLKTLFLIIATLYLAGCSFVTTNYGASFENVEKLKMYSPAKINVKPFTSVRNGTKSITCRGTGPVVNENKETFETYIHSAFVTELKLAGLYDETSNVILGGHFTKLDFNSNIGAGKWMFELTVSSTKNSEVFVTSKYEFSTNWVGDKACQQVAQALSPAVQTLIRDLVSNPKFADLLK